MMSAGCLKEIVLTDFSKINRNDNLLGLCDTWDSLTGALSGLAHLQDGRSKPAVVTPVSGQCEPNRKMGGENLVKDPVEVGGCVRGRVPFEKGPGGGGPSLKINMYTLYSKISYNTAVSLRLFPLGVSGRSSHACLFENNKSAGVISVNLLRSGYTGR